MAGVQYKDGISTDLDEVIGDRVSFHGVHVATAANGDVTVSRYQGAGKLKDGKPVSGEGTWNFTKGTGKFKGIKGKGTFKGTANPDGTHDLPDRRRVPAAVAADGFALENNRPGSPPADFH